MYKIIGGDQQEYGPVTAEQIRQWVAEGRANGQTLARAEGSAEWKPLSALPEFADVFRSMPPAPPLPTAGFAAGPSAVEEILARDYDLDIGSCIVRAWELVKQNFWPVVGITFLVVIAMNVITQGIGLISRASMQEMINNRQINPVGVMLSLLAWTISLPVQTVFTGGLYMYYLKLIRGQEAGISDAFSGLTSALGPLALLGLVQGLLVLLGIVPCLIPGIYLSVAWIFATPLVIDRQIGFWDAMELSRKVVSRHWFTMFALMLVVGLLGICGLLACCIGLFVTIPIGWVALMYAYEDIFGPRTAPAP